MNESVKDVDKADYKVEGRNNAEGPGDGDKRAADVFRGLEGPAAPDERAQTLAERRYEHAIEDALAEERNKDRLVDANLWHCWIFEQIVRFVRREMNGKREAVPENKIK